jgi:plasmid stability protein
MATLQVKNLPEALHARLRRYAQQRHQTMSDIARAALDHEVSRYEWQERLAQRPPTDLGISAAALLEKERAQWQRDTD